MDVESLAKQLILQNMTPEQQNAVLEAVKTSLQEARNNQKRRVSENVGMVVDALKKIEADIRAKYDDLGNQITTRVNSIKDGRDGIDGRDGKDGKDGRPGRDGATGPMGPAGRDGRDGVDGEDGVSVIDAKIDFDGSLVITLSNGREINVGEVVAPDLAERIKVITNGGGTSQAVLDTLASLQTQINNLIPSQTGNSGKFLTTNGTALSWASVAGGLSYQGTWNASTNTPTLTSSVGTNGYYYVVATAGSTNLNGITDWQIGDWLLFNGTVWQKIDQSELVTSVASADASVTVTTTGPAVDLAVYSSPRLIMQVRNETGSTLAKGTVVYINGASGNKATVTKAIATGDTTSAQTLGLIAADLSTNNNGFAIISGEIAGLDTSAFAAGTQLYLSSTTAGGYTSTKQYAPNHLVYVGVVTRSHINQGTIEVRIQNGYEMDELHNVSAQTPADGHVLIYNDTTDLWESHTLTDGTGITITEGAGSITVTNSGVTSLAGTANQVSVSGSTGSVTLSLPSTINVNTTGNAANVTGTVAIVNGGTGQTTQTAAFDALSPLTTKGDLVVNNGTNDVRLAAGTNGYLLTADSTVTEGVKWAAAPVTTSVANDTSTNATYYPTFATATSGTFPTATVSSTKLTFNPSNGVLNATVPRASNGIFINAANVSTSYTIASGDNGVSAGTITVDNGVTVTVSNGSRWVVV